jgi:hypothetical protein
VKTFEDMRHTFYLVDGQGHAPHRAAVRRVCEQAGGHYIHVQALAGQDNPAGSPIDRPSLAHAPQLVGGLAAGAVHVCTLGRHSARGHCCACAELAWAAPVCAGHHPLLCPSDLPARHMSSHVITHCMPKSPCVLSPSHCLLHCPLQQQEEAAQGFSRQGSGGLPRVMSPQERSAMHAMLRTSREELATRFTFAFYDWPMGTSA